MSDEIENSENQDGKDTESQEGSSAQADGTDWKAESRKWEKRAKESNGFKEAAERWYDYEKSQKPENERLFDELASARKDAESAKILLMRYEVAAEKGIPAEAIKLMAGSSKEELEDSADTLMALIAKQSDTKSMKPDPTQGRASNASITTEDQFAAAVSQLL